MAEPNEAICREILKQAQLGAAVAGAPIHLAEEIAQRVAVNIHDKWGTTHVRRARAQGEHYWVNYIRKSARNAYRDHRRSEDRRTAREWKAELEQTGPPPAVRPGVHRPQEHPPSLLEQFEARTYVIELAKQHLQGRQLEVALLALEHGLSVNEMAEHLGLKPRSVNEHLQNAARNLRQRIEEAGSREGGDEI